MDFKYYLDLVVRRLPWILILAFVGTVIGVFVAMSLPPSYDARAVLIVEAEQIPDDLASSTVSTGELETLQIIQQRILSRGSLLELSNRLGVYDGVEDAQTMTADDKVADLRERIEIETRGGAALRGPTEATIVTVRFEAARPELTSSVVNDLVTQILQENVRMRTAVATQTLEFFTQEVGRLDQQLSEVSARILNFQESNLQALPDSLDFRRSQQSTLQERIAQLEREATALRERRRQMVNLFERSGEAAFNQQQSSNQRLTPQQSRLVEMQNEYDRLAVVLSDTNPRLVNLANQIEALETTIANTTPAAADDAGQSVGLSLYEIQLADIDSQIDYITEQVTSLETRLENISQTIEATPGNAVTLGALEREYANLQTQYNQAIANQARAETGNVIESLSKGRRITVVEQAVQPSQPTSPNRPVIAAAGFGGGLALGVALLLLLELLNSSIRRPQDLQKALGIDTLATIPYIRIDAERPRRKFKFMAAVLVLLVALPAALWVVDRSVTPLQPTFQSVWARVQNTLNL